MAFSEYFYQRNTNRYISSSVYACVFVRQSKSVNVFVSKAIYWVMGIHKHYFEFPYVYFVNQKFIYNFRFYPLKSQNVNKNSARHFVPST